VEQWRKLGTMMINGMRQVVAGASAARPQEKGLEVEKKGNPSVERGKPATVGKLNPVDHVKVGDPAVLLKRSKEKPEKDEESLEDEVLVGKQEEAEVGSVVESKTTEKEGMVVVVPPVVPTVYKKPAFLKK
jgi:hypothetical protein